MLSFALILNRQRQAVYANKSFREFLSDNGVGEVIGQRLGDLLGCAHPGETLGGCGTTEPCKHCGAAKSIEQALKGAGALEECRILAKKSGEDLDLRIGIRPFSYNADEFLLMCLMDISAEKRKAVLERLFFHDILNTAGGVQGLVGLMESAAPEELPQYIKPAAKASDRLIDQILSQKDLSAAERGDLTLKPEELDAKELLTELAGLFAAHEVGQGKLIVVAPDSPAFILKTDKTLLSRVISNLVKNALEAEPAGMKITLACEKIPAGAAFTVHNPGRMPDDSRLQIFQRSFSTKGSGRGLGTYSIRLLTEKYLKGRVSFITGTEGTFFRVECPQL